MISTLYTKLVIFAISIFAIISVGYVAYDHIYTKGAESIQIKWDDAEAKRKVIIDELKAKADKSSLNLKEEHLKQQKVLNEKNINLNKSLIAITRELQKRPDRPSATGVSTDTCDGTAATGAELYRPDAEFLIGEAARAEQVKIQLELCTVLYNKVYEDSLDFQTK